VAVKSCSSENAKDHVMRENGTSKNLYGFFCICSVAKLFLSLSLQMYVIKSLEYTAELYYEGSQ